VSLLDREALDAVDLVGEVEMVRADVRDEAAVDRAVCGKDLVVHAAAALPIRRSRRRIFGVNLGGTEVVLRACRRHSVRRLVYISSTAVYGVPGQLPETERTPLHPIGHYGRSKVAAERLCFRYQRQGLSINILRPKTFLGPERLGVFQLWFEAIYRGKRVFILGNGRNRFQLLAVADVVDAIVRALTSAADGGVFNVGAREFGTWRTDLGAVISAAGSRAEITPLPTLPCQTVLWGLEQLNLSPIAEWHYRTMPVDSYVAIERARELLGWEPRQSNRELLVESYRWYAEHRAELLDRAGLTHRVGWDFKLLDLAKWLP
jgi:nucleoside-diphosphate-sugar epimerase